MLDFEKLLDNYAQLTVKIGLNLQKNQTLVINSSIECYDFVRKVTKAAYESGAKNVHVEWHDEEVNHLKLLMAPEEALKEYPMWRAKGLEELAADDAAFLSISASNPELLKDVNPERIAMTNKSASTALKEYRKYMMNSTVTWCVVSVPTKGWAKKVFPQVNEDEAVSLLWNKVFSVVRADAEDSVKAWEEHINNLNSKMNFLNEKAFKSLHFKSAITDLTIELPMGHIWCGGGEYNAKDVYFVANMPTEEVFTVPLKTGVNGKVSSTKPLNYGGNLINNFTLTFKDGRIVDFTAEEGYEILKKLIEIDDGSHYLGEVALVPFSSPISQTGVVFFNTLIDENASCHLAIGKGYPSCLKDGINMNDDELESNGVNNSLTHNDFMIGSADLDIIGETETGEKIQIFKSGDWAF
jgi:aminopeptidase